MITGYVTHSAISKLRKYRTRKVRLKIGVSKYLSKDEKSNNTVNDVAPAKNTNLKREEKRTNNLLIDIILA